MEFQTIVIWIIVLIIFSIIKRPRIGANEPPLVPYTIPILGHTFQYLFNTTEFIKNCREQYGDCFSLYIFGNVETIVSRNYLNVVLKNHNDFDVNSASKEFFPFEQIFIHKEVVDFEGQAFHTQTARDQISDKLDAGFPIVQKSITKGIDKWIGDCDVPKTFYKFLLPINNIVAWPAANIIVGEEAGSHEDLVNTFANFAFDISPIIKIPPILAFIHKKLHIFVVSLPLKLGWNPVKYHREIIMKRIKPVIEKRLKEKIELGDKYKPYNDVIEYYMTQPNFDYSRPDILSYYADNIFVLIFVSIVATSVAVTNALFDMAGRPECVDELYEEALIFDKECNGLLTVSDIKRMKKLDSFFKESLRHSGNIVGLPRYMVSKSFTFSEGLTIPKGRLTRLYLDDLLKSKESYGDDAEEFKPFRFVDTNSPATRVDRSYVAFGGARHACPGRHFAVNEAKFLLHKLILKYNFKTESGKIDDKLVIGPLALPPRSGIIIEKRK